MVKDDQSNVVHDLRVVHERPLHLLVISDDLAAFYHLHPEPATDGSFRVQHTFQHGGHYHVYADFTPRDAAQVIAQFALTVHGSARPTIALVEDTAGTKIADGVHVTMTTEQPLRAGEESMLTFTVTDATTHTPVTDLEPYLGALAHFVIVSDDGRDFLHAHPMEHTEMAGAHGHSSHHAALPMHAASMAHDTSSMPIPSASAVNAHTTFPRAGVYKIWVQLQRGGRVITVPWVVRAVSNEQP
jgi:hypothetical protein